MSENLLYMAIAAFVIGVVLFAISNKQRQTLANGQTLCSGAIC